MKTCNRCGVEQPFEAFPNKRALVCVGCRNNPVCKDCAAPLNPDNRAGQSLLCVSCKAVREARRYEENRVAMRARNKAWYEKNAQPGSPYWTKQRQKQREYNQRIKDEVYNHYGGYVCACCGETEPMFLTIDHINNNGNEHRRGKKQTSTYHLLYRENFPPGFQILCLNCNMGRHRNKGVCPHEQGRSAAQMEK